MTLKPTDPEVIALVAEIRRAAEEKKEDHR
jgi:hypothetical protein